MRFLLMVVMVLVALGCLPKADCTPGAESCGPLGEARTCSSTGHGWAASGAPVMPCASVGGRCIVEGGRVRCAPLSDAGTDGAR